MRILLQVLKRAALIAALALAGLPVHAAIDLVGDDTDLFTTNPNIPSQIPRVLIILDNTSNWAAQNQNWPTPAIPDAGCPYRTSQDNQQGDAEVCALYKILTKLNQNVAVGLMMFEDQQTAGGYIRFPILPMDDTNRSAFQTVLSLVSTNNPGDKGPSSANAANIMNDSFRYFNSLATYSGVAVGRPGGPPSPQADVRGYASSFMQQFAAHSDWKDNACGYDYIIYIGNGPPSKDSITPDLPNAAALLNDPSVTPNTIPINNVGVNPDVWSRFMFNYGVKISNGVYKHVTTYTIDVCKDQCNQLTFQDWAGVLTSTATVSNGLALTANDEVSIYNALDKVFSQIQAVNSVFAATTLPVSINVRGTNLNQVYIGVFRPDAALSPRWFGNLKQYRLGLASGSTTQLQLVDANGDPAVNLNTGFIFNTATSVWTQPSSFWSFRSPFKSTDVGGASDSPDGDLVEKGGAAQQIRTVYPVPDSTMAQTRNIYTCTGACAAGSQLKNYAFDENNASITAAQLGTFVTTNLDSLTASGQTATGTINAGQSFTAGQQVVILGASPLMYNGTFTVLSSPAPTATQFSYSLSPNTPDTTHAYVTLPGYTLVPGSDLVMVTGAAPSVYNTNTTSAIAASNAIAITAASGDPTNQFYYTLSSSATSSASGYSVTALHKASSLVWSSATNLVTASTVSAHGYSNGDTVTVSGASDAAFNVPGVSSGIITNVTANSFTYAPNTSPSGGTTNTGVATSSTAHGFSSTDTIVVSGASPAAFNTAASGSSITNVSATQFTYTTSATVSGNATTPGTAQKRSTSDIDTYTVTNAASGTGNTLVLTVGTGVPAVSGQLPHTLAVNDKIAVTGVTCTGRTCSTASSTSYTFTISAVGTGTITLSPGGNGTLGTITTSSPKVFWSAAANGSFTLSSPVTLSTITQGPTLVTASGTIYVGKSGDLTSKVTSITSQGVATGTITVSDSSAADPTGRQYLIRWVRGHDNVSGTDENGNGTSSTCDSTNPGSCDIRASVHGDVLHSRPAVVNYNRHGDDNDVYVFYGANDGMLHAIKGGSASDGGTEQWAFVAPEFFGKLKRLRDQSPRISSSNARDYFFDGSIAVYTLDANRDGKLVATDGDKVYLFITMRRGGRQIYALDVSDPANPKLLWKKGCSEATGSGTAAGSGGCDSGFGEMGETWSQPQLGYLRKWPTTLVLIVGAGYDKPAEDFQPCMVSNWTSGLVTGLTNVVPPVPMDTTTCPPSGGTSTTKNRTTGRGIFILNATTGAILWTAGPSGSSATKQVSGMDYSIVADIAALRNRSNTTNRANDIGNESVPIGYFDRLYAPDTGGQVWRVDVADISDGADTATPPNFLVTQLASIAAAPAAGTHPALNYRKFMAQPDVVYSSDANGAYDAVLLGSGDREHVWDMVVKNRFYMFKDRSTGSLTSSSIVPAAITESVLYDATSNCLQTCTGTNLTGAQSALLSASGWMLQLANIGEKTVAPATTAAGTVIFNTHQPKEDTVSGQSSGTANQCVSDLGTARQYGISFENATSTNIFSSLPPNMVGAGGGVATFAGGGFLPQPVPAVVMIDGKVYQTVIAGVQTTNPGGLKLQSRLRTYWYKKTD